MHSRSIVWSRLPCLLLAYKNLGAPLLPAPPPQGLEGSAGAAHLSFLLRSAGGWVGMRQVAGGRAGCAHFISCPLHPPLPSPSRPPQTTLPAGGRQHARHAAAHARRRGLHPPFEQRAHAPDAGRQVRLHAPGVGVRVGEGMVGGRKEGRTSSFLAALWQPAGSVLTADTPRSRRPAPSGRCRTSACPCPPLPRRRNPFITSGVERKATK